MAKKRKSGSGTLRKRKDGRWEGRVVIGYDDNGLPKTKNVLGKTRTECLDKLNKLREECAPPIRKCREDMPFGDWMAFWYETYCKPQISPRTQEGYADRIYKHIIPELGQIPLNKLTQNDLQQFYARLKTSGRLIRVEQFGPGLSDRMVRVCHASCRSALEKAVQEVLIRINPAIGCKLPPKKSREMQVLTQEEMQRFLIQAKQDGYYELFLLELGTGMRLGEILALQWTDLNFRTGELRIDKSMCYLGGKLQITEPKTKSSVRTVILPESLLEVLKRYKETINSRWMFPSPAKADAPLTQNFVRRRMQQTLKRAGCKVVRFHDLRHPYVKHTTKIFSLRLMDFQAQAYPDARRKTRGACQLHQGGQSRSPVRLLCNRKQLSCLPPQSKMSWILYAISMRLSGYTSTRSISSSASSVVSVSASKIALDASLRLSCRACSSCFCFACANTAA